jgi:hypothetical protein
MGLVPIAIAGCGRLGFAGSDSGTLDQSPGDARDAIADAALDARTGPTPGHVLSLDGQGYVIADGATTGITVAMTVCAWIWPKPGAPGGHWAAFNDASGGSNLSLLQWDPTNHHVNYYDDFATNYGYSTVTGPEGVWHFVAIVIDAGGNGTALQDGVAEETFTTSRTLTAGSRFSLGQEWDGTTPSDFYTGKIDEVTVYSVARTQTQLASEIANGPDPIDPDLVAYYPFENAAMDASGHGHDGTLVSTATIVTN